MIKNIISNETALNDFGKLVIKIKIPQVIKKDS